MTAIFVSLPVTDLERSKKFYTAIGLTFNPAMSDHNSACMVVEEGHSYLMIMTREFLQTFTELTIGDPSKNPISSISIFKESREVVDSTVAAGLEAGGGEPHEPTDFEFMYQRGLDDPDGNPLEIGWMDMSAPMETAHSLDQTA